MSLMNPKTRRRYLRQTLYVMGAASLVFMAAALGEAAEGRGTYLVNGLLMAFACITVTVFTINCVTSPGVNCKGCNAIGYVSDIEPDGRCPICEHSTFDYASLSSRAFYFGRVHYLPHLVQHQSIDGSELIRRSRDDEHGDYL